MTTSLASSISAILQRVDKSYIFGRVGEQEMSQVGLDPHPIASDIATLSSASVLAMATDPAHGGKISAGNVQEAAVGLMAQHLGALPSLQRESTGGAEFIEPSGQTWDVKSPVSPPAMPTQTWVFDANHQVDKLRNDFSQGDHVLLDTSRCNHADTQQLLKLLQTELSASEKAKVLVFYERF